MQSTKKLVKDCKQLTVDYSNRVNDYVSRTHWAARQMPSSFDDQTIELMEAHLTQARNELETKILMLELHLPRD